jgi:hypothetical protein
LTPEPTAFVGVNDAPIVHPRAASAPPLDHRKHSTVRGYPGFLGSTSYSSIFTESLGNLGVLGLDLEAAQTESISIPNDKIARGCQVLALLKDRFLINRFIDRWFELTGGCGVIVIQPIMKGWVETMWRDHGAVLKEQNPEKIRNLCERIWQNTQAPLIFDGTTSAKQWIGLGTGHNLRWEVPGLICAIVGLSARTLMDSDSLFREHSTSRAALTKRMSEAANTCISFCRECEAVDDMFIWLLLETEPLTSAIKGEGSKWHIRI